MLHSPRWTRADLAICCGLHYMNARLAREPPSWPTIIDSIQGLRPKLWLCPNDVVVAIEQAGGDDVTDDQLGVLDNNTIYNKL